MRKMNNGAKRPIYKRKWFIIIVVIVVLGVIGTFMNNEDKEPPKPQNETTPTEVVKEDISKEDKEVKEEQSKIIERNKTNAWGAVQNYMADVKGLKRSDWSLEKVEIDSDGNYVVYTSRKMIDGSEGIFKYILKPYNPATDGTIKEFTLVEDCGQVFE